MATPNKRANPKPSPAPTPLSITGLAPEMRKALSSAVKRALYLSLLAEIKDLQEAYTGENGTEFRFDPDGADKGERPWDSADNQAAEEPEKLVTPPVRITPAMCAPLAALFVDVVNLVNATGKLRGDSPLTALVNGADHDGSLVLRGILAVTEAMAHLLRGGYMSREFGCPEMFEQKLAVLVARRSDVDPGGNVLAALFYRFIKCIGWHVAHACWEQKHYVFNEDALRALLAALEAVVADNDREALAMVQRRVRLAFAELAADAEEKKAERAAAAKAPKKSPLAVKAAAPAAIRLAPTKDAKKAPITGAPPPVLPIPAAAPKNQETAPPAERGTPNDEVEIDDDDAADGHETGAEPAPAQPEPTPQGVPAEKKKVAVKLAALPRTQKSDGAPKPKEAFKAPPSASKAVPKNLLKSSSESTGSELSEADSHSASSNQTMYGKPKLASNGKSTPPRSPSSYFTINYDDLSEDLKLNGDE
jgi:hypothetical protein